MRTKLERDAERDFRRLVRRQVERLLAVASASVGQNLSFGSGGLEWVTPAATAGATVSMKAVTVTVPYGEREHTEAIVDADVLTTSTLMVAWGACTDDDENGPAAGDVSLLAVPAETDGGLSITLFAVGNAVLGGPYKLTYLISTP